MTAMQKLQQTLDECVIKYGEQLSDLGWHEYGFTNLIRDCYAQSDNQLECMEQIRRLFKERGCSWQ